MPEQDVMRGVYEEYDRYQFRDYIPASDLPDNPRILQIKRLVGTGKRILDIGVSRGDFALALAKEKNEVIGVDISSKAVEICRQRGIEAYRVNIETEPLPAVADFDIILMLEILEHLIDPLLVLRKLRGILNPSGFLLLSTPNAAYIKWRLELLRGRMPDFGEDRQVSSEPRPYNLLHKTPVTIPDLYHTLDMAGYEIVHLEAEDYGVSKAWDRPGLRGVRNWLRQKWVSVLAGSMVAKASPRDMEAHG
jgi:SAM-dependent methyltransferase